MATLTKTFNGAHTFYIDPTSVNGASTADISKIDLFFKFKPDLNLNLNNSVNPGVTVFIAETMYGVPRITRESGIFTGQYSWVSLNDIKTSSDATVPTEFRFTTPVNVETDKEYCFVFIFDFLSQFELWKSKQGEVLTGSNNISPGASSRFVGKYYDFNSVFVASDDTNLDEYLKNWRAINDTTLKFSVYIARYSHNNVPVTSNASIDSADITVSNPLSNVTANTTLTNFNVNFGSYEFISFNENRSNKSAFIGAQYAYQNTVFYPGGYENSGSYISLTTVAANTLVTANTQYPNGANFAWTDIYPQINELNFIVLTDENKVNIRTIASFVSNTEILLDEPPTFSNSDAKMMITPVGQINSFDKSSPFGVSDAFVILNHSTANSTVRFVNNTIEAVSVTAGGSGYSNSDIFYVKGFESVANKVEGGYIAVGNITTNTTGGITAIYLSNAGAGFVNSSTMEAVIANSTSGNTTGNTSAGSSATFTYTVGATLKTEYGNTVLRECKVKNIDIGEFIPYSSVNVPPGTNFELRLETNYLQVSDNTTYSGFAYYVNPNAANTQLQITMYNLNSLEQLSYTPCIPSKSNEFNIKYEDTSVNDKISNSSVDSSQSLKIVSDLTTNSDYSIVRMTRPAVQFSKYIINNDATNEHTDSGNAYAKHLTKTINFGRTSEDIRVYLTAYKPANTDIKVYARIYKNEDPEAFDDKDWSLLELKDGQNILSSSTDVLDYIELTYGFPQVPATRTPIDGVVTVTTACNEINGVGTDFTTDLANNDLVYFYQPLFRENHFVAAIEEVVNTTHMTIDFTTSNSSILAEGMKIEKITYPNQAFNNKQNDNIVRYYNTTMSNFDGYETLAIKIVFLSDSPHRIPRVDDIRITGVSA